MKTTTLKPKDITRRWYLIDCTDKIIGRVSTEVAKRLQGKYKANYAPNLDAGDHIILINTSKIKWTGEKGSKKLYRKHTGYQGGLKEKNLDEMMRVNPNVVLETSISKMLPKNRMRSVYLNKLHCFSSAEHTHEAQKPQTLEI
ncbi:MAG: 50S ribosomal protein L13 [Candidatus Dojkabacteria bacterium]